MRSWTRLTPRRSASVSSATWSLVPSTSTTARRPSAKRVLGEPGLRDALLGPGEPGLGDEVLELVALEPRELRDPHQHRRVAVEVRSGEEDPAVVGEQELLHVEVGDAEHEHVVEPLAGGRIERVGSAAPLAAEELAVHLVRGAAVVRELLRRLR